jgi:hypothetical protein
MDKTLSALFPINKEREQFILDMGRSYAAEKNGTFYS